jgi:hypothetical protein
MVGGNGDDVDTEGVFGWGSESKVAAGAEDQGADV